MKVDCLDCVQKHLAQASINVTESLLGYPEYRVYVIGHMAEAEDECVQEHLELAKAIRTARTQYWFDNKMPDFNVLFEMVDDEQTKEEGENDET